MPAIVSLPGIGAVAAATLAVGCAAAGSARTKPATPAHELETFRFVVYGMTCDACAKHAARKMQKLSGVVTANVDFDSKQATVQAKRATATFPDIQSALETLGFEALLAGHKPLAPLSDEEKKTLDIRTLSQGERINVREHLARGKVTVFDYYADWCGPCHLLTPKLERLVLEYENVALRKVDLANWESAAARQASSEFQLPGLPFTRVFDDRGNLLGQVHGNFIEEIESIIRANAKPKRRGRP